MTTYAIIENGAVVNLIEWDGNMEDWAPGSGETAVAATGGVFIGQAYDGTAFLPPEIAQPSLPDAQAAKIAELYNAYQAATQVPVAYKTVAGISQTFQADAASQNTLLVATTGYNLAGGTPLGFYWVAVDNTQVPFSLADLAGLYGAMLAQGNAAFNKLQALKTQVRGATSVGVVQAIVWS